MTMTEPDFLLVNIARWQTAEAFGAALDSAGFRESAAGLAGYPKKTSASA
jgi:hypothetical protein